jgi:hypothetical protein
MSLNHRMAEAHEKDLQERLGGRRTRGSGNQPANPMDGRHSRYSQPVALAWDAKATRGLSISVTRKMWSKAEEQAHGERPALPLRFYDSDRLKVWRDLIVLDLDDTIELLENSDRLRVLQGALQRLNEGASPEEVFPDQQGYDGELHRMIAGLVQIAEH